MGDFAQERCQGVVYTKRWIVDMVLDLAGYVSGSGIVDKVVVEPSCGCGAFMTAIAERLAKEAMLMERPWMDLADSARGYDISPASIEKTRHALICSLVQNGCPEQDAACIAGKWLTCGDFILSRVPSCDFVVGNPPYVRATEIGRRQRALYCKLLPSVTNGCDLYVSFFDKGLDVLKTGGALCFICADRWLQNAYGRRLRQRVGASCSLSALVRMHGVDAFESSVDAYPAITLIRRAPPAGRIRFVDCRPDFGPEGSGRIMKWLRKPERPLHSSQFDAFEMDRPEKDAVYPLGNSDSVGFVNRAIKKLPSLEESGIRIGIGVATGCDRVFITCVDDLVEAERMLPLFSMRDYRRGKPGTRRWLVNPWNDDGTLVDLDEYPRLKAYFEDNAEALRNRHVARGNKMNWYRTIDRLIPGLTRRDLLLMPDMATTSDPVLSRGLYPAHNTYWIASDAWDLHVLGGLLMADTTRRFVDALGVKMRGGTMRFQAQYLRLVRLPAPDQIRQSIKNGLAAAFDNGDRDAATRLAEAAYGEAMK